MSLTWSWPSSFHLASDEVHLWCARLDVAPETTARLMETLSADERARSARFRFQRDQQRFIVARGVLRDLLSRYVGIEPDEIRFVYNEFGKPDLDPELASRLRFNLTHSGAVALIAVASESEVGVDLEYIRAEPDYADIARRFFSPAEHDALNALPSHLYADAFFSCWTKKEAYLKACGEGLARPLNSFSVLELEGWSLYSLRPAPGYVGALAIEGSAWRLRQWQWTMPQIRIDRLSPSVPAEPG